MVASLADDSSPLLLLFAADVIAGCTTLLVGFASDILGVATRPVVLLGQTGFASGTAESFATGGVLTGLMGTFSVVLLAVGVSTICGRIVPRTLTVLAAVPYLIDGPAQLPQLLFPNGSVPLALAALAHYPASQTGFPALLQIAGALAAVAQALDLPEWLTSLRWIPDWLITRLLVLLVAVCLRYSAADLLGGSGPMAQLLMAIAAVNVFYCLTPSALWQQLGRLLEHLASVVKACLSSAYLCLERTWPRVKAALIWLLTQPPLVAFYTRVLVPVCSTLDRLVFPWIVPAITANVALSCAAGFAHLASAAPTLASSAPAHLAGLAFCGAAAMLSTLVLALHAACQATPRVVSSHLAEPLRSSIFTVALSGMSHAIAFPWSALRCVWVRVLLPLLGPLLRWTGNVLSRLFSLAVHVPFLSIPLTIAFNVLVLWAAREHAAWLQAQAAHGGAMLGWLGQAVVGLRTVSLHSAIGTDAGFALVLMASLQVATYYVVGGSVQAVRRSVRRASTGDALSAEELGAIAGTMSDPRQCGRCGFGPVDHAGCDSLSSHHGEVAMGRSSGANLVSNACPRCGWFVPSLRAWPAWDGLYATAEGRAVLRQRAWSEVAVLVRASSKALLVPYMLLQLGTRLGMPTSLAAAIAISYLLPWAIENARTFRLLVQPPAHTRSDSAGPARRRPAAAGDDHCAGSARRAGADTATIEPAEAIANLLGAAPERLFLIPGDVCSVCLEAFPELAAGITETHTGAEAAQAFGALEPPIVGLRCGHVLHLECAEAAVRVADRRHVRCPLCREPVTRAGVASARAFN